MPNSLKNNSRKRIAICGIRGIPACYGGFETFAEELSPRLIELGFDVAVYGRSHVIDYSQPTYKGAEIRLLPAPKHKYLETPVHTISSFYDIVKRRDIDLVLLCNAANSPFIPLVRLFGVPVIVNVDGIERKRAKWNWLGKLWYRIGEISSVMFANEVVADADMIRDYYKSVYNCSSTVIRYGFSDHRLEISKRRVSEGSPLLYEEESAVFRKFGLKEGKYLLYVSRLEPENNAHTVISAYSKVPKVVQQQFPLVIVGDAPYSDEYKLNLKHLAENSNTIFTGYQFGESYEQLQLGAYCYIQASEVGGTHPALVEALGFANLVIANDTPEHREVVQDCGLYYEKNSISDLTLKLSEVTDPDFDRLSYQLRARNLIQKSYSWDKIAHDYKELVDRLLD